MIGTLLELKCTIPGLCHPSYQYPLINTARRSSLRIGGSRSVHSIGTGIIRTTTSIIAAETAAPTHHAEKLMQCPSIIGDQALRIGVHRNIDAIMMTIQRLVFKIAVIHRTFRKILFPLVLNIRA